MRRFLFWGTALVLLAAAAHIVTSVFFPQLEREDTVETLMGASEVNRVTVLADEDKLKEVLRGIPTDMAYAICPYDISERPIEISAPLPGTYWSISIFEPSGRNIYTLNDTQVGTDRFAAVIMLGEAKTAAEEDTSKREGGGIVIHTKETSGVVVIRAFIEDLAARKSAQDALSASECKPALATASTG